MNNSCYSIDKIKQELNIININLLTLNTYLELSDYNDPIKNYTDNFIIQGNTNTSRTDLFYYRMIQIFTDSGWFFEDFQKIETFQINHLNNFIQDYNNEFLFKIQLSQSHLTKIYFRRYRKLFTGFSYIGGIITFLLFFFNIFNNYFSHITLLNNLLYSIIENSQQLPKLINSNKSLSNSFRKYNTIQIHKNKIEQREYKPRHLVNINDESEIKDFKQNSILRNNTTMKTLGRRRTIKSKIFCSMCCINYNNSLKNSASSIKRIDHLLKKRFDVKNIFKLYDMIKITDTIIFENKGRLIKNYLAEFMVMKKIKKEKIKKNNSKELTEFISRMKQELANPFLNLILKEVYIE
jgi:hypothetical protein